MTKWAWHVHHDVLLEPLVEPIETRIAFIKAHKPKKETATRLRLLKPVKGPLPAKLLKAGKASVKAWKAYDKAWKAYDKAWKASVKAGEAYDKAWEASVKAGEASVKAGEAVDVLALHAKECPGCPWNGRTIFQ